MSAGITGEMFVQAVERGPAWHSIKHASGPVQVGEQPSDTLVRLGADFLVEKGNLAAWSENMGLWVPCPDKFAIIRPPIDTDAEPKVLGIVGDDYTIVQHADLAAALDSLAQAGWQLETLGVLHEGAQLFSAFAAEGYVLNADEITEYYVATVRHAASALRIFPTQVRVVCQNTLNLALSGAENMIAIPHYASVQQELGWAVDVVRMAKEISQQRRAEQERMGEVRLDKEQIEAFIADVYREPALGRRAEAIEQRVQTAGELGSDVQQEYEELQERHAKATERVQELRECVRYSLDSFNQERSDYADTGWALLNSVTFVTSHLRGKLRGESLLFGGDREEAQHRAYRHLLQVI